MTDRLKSLARIQAVQGQMVRLTEWRLAEAERSCRTFAEDQTRLRAYVSGEDSAGEAALSAPLARAALKSIHIVSGKLAKAERDRAIQKEKLTELKRRDHVAAAMAEKEKAVARRVDEDKTLAQTMDAWFANGALPRS